MTQRHIGTLLDRKAINDINDNFTELYDEYIGAGLDAAEAREKAIQAVADAEIAKETAETTREEMLAIIREQTQNGDLAPEIAQARQGKETLGENLNSIKSDLAQKPNHKNNYYPVETPDSFMWKDNPLVNKIYTDGLGNFKILDFDVSFFQPTGKTYYVDINNGDDANDGLTLTTAFKSIHKAYNMEDAVVIMVAQGVYDRDHSMHGSSNIIKKDVAIKAIPGHVVEIAATFPISWSKTAGMNNVYESNTGNATMLLDTKHKDRYGDYVRLVRRSTVAEVEQMPGSYHFDGSKVSIHTADSRVPDDKIWRFTGGTLLESENAIVYLEGLKVYEGNGRRFKGGKIFAKNCEFKYGAFSTNNVVSMIDTELSIMQNCVAALGLKDGFHYSGEANAIEINCVGRHNGVSTNASNQGSTIHTGCKIIRINGNYYHNQGASIADDGVNAESWNMGNTNYGSLGITDSQNSNYMCYEGAKMWLDGNLGHSSNYDISGTGEVYIRNNNLLSAKQIHSSTPVSVY